MDSSISTNGLSAAIQSSSLNRAHAAHGWRGVQRSDAAQDSGRVQGHPRDHGHTHGQRGADRVGSGDAAYATLRIKIEQTLSKLADADDGLETSANPDTPAMGPISLKARIEISGPGGRLDARLSLQGGAAGTDFGAALKSFTDAMFSALQTLYGNAPQAPALAAPGATGANVAPSTSLTAATAASPTVVTDALATGAAATAAGATPSVASSGSGSLSIKLRLSYNSFDNQLGSLVKQLAQPDVGQTTPALADPMGELASRFAQLLAMARGAGSAQPTLGSFLAALSSSISPPPSAAAAQPPSATPDPVIDTLEPLSSSATAAAPRIAATIDYRQLMSLGDATASFSLHARFGGGAVFAVA